MPLDIFSGHGYISAMACVELVHDAEVDDSVTGSFDFPCCDMQSRFTVLILVLNRYPESEKQKYQICLIFSILEQPEQGVIPVVVEGVRTRSVVKKEETNIQMPHPTCQLQWIHTFYISVIQIGAFLEEDFQ
jgi:hypothetical protein